MPRLKSTAREANREAKQAAANPIFELATRWGYVVRGCLYGTMGVVGLLLSVGLVRHAADQKGALAYLAASLPGFLILGVFSVGLAAYSLWGFIRAIYDPLHRGRRVTGTMARLGFAWSGLAYGSLLVAVLQFLAGAGETLRRDSVQAAVLAILTRPLGPFVTALAGLIGIAAGLAQFADAWKATFAPDLKRGEMSRGEYRLALTLGRLGMMSRGVIFTITGWFVLRAAVHRDPKEAHGFGTAFDELLKQWSGHLLVALVALGFIALALHSFAYARWVRMLSTSS